MSAVSKSVAGLVLFADVAALNPCTDNPGVHIPEATSPTSALPHALAALRGVSDSPSSSCIDRWAGSLRTTPVREEQRDCAEPSAETSRKRKIPSAPTGECMRIYKVCPQYAIVHEKDVVGKHKDYFLQMVRTTSLFIRYAMHVLTCCDGCMIDGE